MHTHYEFSPSGFRFLIILFASALTACQTLESAPSKPNVDVLIVAGQSNAVGFDAFAADLPKDDADASVPFWWRVGDPPPDEFDSTSGSMAWHTLAAQPKGTPKPKGSERRQYGNFKGPDGGFGPEMGLARRLVEEHPASDIAVIKVAFSGTSLHSDWRPTWETSSTDPVEPEVGACYRALIEETRIALAAARQEGWEPRLRGFCWIQGESDTVSGAAGAYAENMQGLIAALRRDLGAPKLPVLMAFNTHFRGNDRPLLKAVVNAQRLVASDDPHAAYVDTSAATLANAAHFDAPGTLDVGKWFAEALLELEADPRSKKR